MSELRTERLRLRPFVDGDLDELAGIFADPQVWWYPFRRGFAREETEAFLGRRIREWDSQGRGHWAVEQDGQLLGYTGFALPTFLPEVMPQPEIGWRLAPAHWGRGVATEAATAVLAEGFERLGFDAVVSIYEPENAASGRVMQRLGMSVDRETTHPELGLPLRVYRLTRQDWSRAAAAPVDSPPGWGRPPGGGRPTP